MKKNLKPVEDVVMVKREVIACDGGSVALGHPQVFLHIDHKTGDVVCPYCEKRFVLEVY